MKYQSAKAIVLGLSDYLGANPQACDGIDGIACWWFDPRGSIDEDVLNMVLQDLIRRGALEALVVGDRTFYRLAHRAALDDAVRAFSPGEPTA